MYRVQRGTTIIYELMAAAAAAVDIHLNLNIRCMQVYLFFERF